MQIREKIYIAVKKEFNNMSNYRIGEIIGVSHSMIAKLNRGIGTGEAVARYLSENFDGYDELYREAIAENRKRVLAGAQKRQEALKEKQPHIFDFTALSTPLQRFAGYLA